MSLPLPPHWRSAYRLTWRPAVMFFTFGTVGLVAGLEGAGTGRASTVGLALFQYAMALQCLPRRGLGFETRDGALLVLAPPVRTVVPLVGMALLGLGSGTVLGMPSGLVIAAGYAAWILFLVRRHGVGDLRLDPEGVTLPTGRRLAWADAGVESRRFGRIRLGGVPVRLAHYETDPALLYWTLRFYATHPESRDELADLRAVERVRRGDLTATYALASGW